MNKFSQLISDGDGQPSSMRFAFLYVVITVMTAWFILSIRKGDLIPIDWTQVATVVFAFLGKAAQARSENRLLQVAPLPG